MAADLQLLSPELRDKVEKLIAKLRDRGIEMRASAGVRTPAEQAKLWRQSRTKEEIDAAISKLRSQNAHFLADVVSSVGPQHGAHVTNSLPGLSWHQWGEALDCFWVIDGKAEWSLDRLELGHNGYKVYAQEAVALGLDAGGLWQSFKDWPHVQLRAAASPREIMTIEQIDAEMRKRFG